MPSPYGVALGLHPGRCVCGEIVGGRVCFVWYAFFTIKKCMSTLLLFYWVTLLFLNFFFRGTIGTIHAMRLSRSFEVTFYLYQVTPIFMPSETYTNTKWLLLASQSSGVGTSFSMVWFSEEFATMRGKSRNRSVLPLAFASAFALAGYTCEHFWKKFLVSLTKLYVDLD